MKKSDLYREWARVLDMCEGTNISPDDCWKFDGTLINDVPAFDDHPDYYSFAVAILDNKPVFVGDVIYAKTPKEIKYDAVEKWIVADGYNDYPHSEIDDRKFSWQPPKKTFSLNGEELPCPELEPNYNFCAKLDIYGGYDHLFTCRFRSHDDRNKVADAIIKLLKDAKK